MNAPAMRCSPSRPLIWGSTGSRSSSSSASSPPEVSVAYRFALAAVLLAAWCVATRPLARVPGAHAAVARGAGRDDVRAQLRRRLPLPSGYVDIGTGGRAVLDDRVHDADRNADRFRHADGAARGDRRGAGRRGRRAAVPAGASSRPAKAATPRSASPTGSAATLIAAVGNIVAMRLQRDDIPMFPATAWGMVYGALTAALVARSGVPRGRSTRACLRRGRSRTSRVRQHRRVRRLLHCC